MSHVFVRQVRGGHPGGRSGIGAEEGWCLHTVPAYQRRLRGIQLSSIQLFTGHVYSLSRYFIIHAELKSIQGTPWLCRPRMEPSNFNFAHLVLPSQRTTLEYVYIGTFLGLHVCICMHMCPLLGGTE